MSSASFFISVRIPGTSFTPPGNTRLEKASSLEWFAFFALRPVNTNTHLRHLAGRVVLGLQHSLATTVVMAGGVAANSYLRYMQVTASLPRRLLTFFQTRLRSLREWIRKRQYCFPSPKSVL